MEDTTPLLISVSENRKISVGNMEVIARLPIHASSSKKNSVGKALEFWLFPTRVRVSNLFRVAFLKILTSFSWKKHQIKEFFRLFFGFFAIRLRKRIYDT
ncbi:MAG: hypothetical protein KBT02_05195 [Treponema sp.]|nr:hypothetical protein [Candidatus Treponema caballi]